MAIGTDVIDDIDSFEDVQPLDNPPVQDPTNEPNEEEEDVLDTLLKQRGIQDRTKIKFENEDGEIEDRDWDSLSNQEKLNILQNSEEVDYGLEDSEIELLQAIRDSNLTPQEYMNAIQQNAINYYLQNSQQPQYDVDSLTDDELFVTDLLSKMGDSLTDDEARQALENAKSNPELYSKQIGALRKEYKSIEDDNRRQAQFEQEEQAQERFNQFSDSVVESINNLTEIQGYDLNLEDEDMQDIYDFITGQDAAGQNYMAKALADPDTLVKMAYFALNGEKMIQDITDYFQKEITQVRRASYEKGVADAKSGKDNVQVVFKSKSQTKQSDNEDIDYDF